MLVNHRKCFTILLSPDLLNYKVRKLLTWCRKQGLQVELGNESCYWPSHKCIHIDWARSKEVQLYHLLHECGHYLIHKSGGYPGGGGDQRLRETRQAILAEEIEAWLRGRRLASRLGIRVNKQRWTECRTKELGTYIRWVAAIGKGV